MRSELLICAGLLLPLPVLGIAAAETKINKVTYGSPAGKVVETGAQLSPEQILRLKKIFLFPAIDDLSGARLILIHMLGRVQAA